MKIENNKPFKYWCALFVVQLVISLAPFFQGEAEPSSPSVYTNIRLAVLFGVLGVISLFPTIYNHKIFKLGALALCTIGLATLLYLMGRDWELFYQGFVYIYQDDWTFFYIVGILVAIPVGYYFVSNRGQAD